LLQVVEQTHRVRARAGDSGRVGREDPDEDQDGRERSLGRDGNQAEGGSLSDADAGEKRPHCRAGYICCSPWKPDAMLVPEI
jgi:hypothetical protein